VDEIENISSRGQFGVLERLMGLGLSLASDSPIVHHIVGFRIPPGEPLALAGRDWAMSGCATG
jgi:hypothetical protein